MADNAREALEEFIDALREHLEVALAIQDPDADEVLDAAEALGDAFEDYDEALFEASGVDTPLDNLDGYDDEDEDDDDLEDEDDDGDDLDDDSEDDDLEDEDDEDGDDALER